MTQSQKQSEKKEVLSFDGTGSFTAFRFPQLEGDSGRRAQDCEFWTWPGLQSNATEEKQTSHTSQDTQEYSLNGAPSKNQLLVEQSTKAANAHSTQKPHTPTAPESMLD